MPSASPDLTAPRRPGAVEAGARGAPEPAAWPRTVLGSLRTRAWLLIGGGLLVLAVVIGVQVHGQQAAADSEQRIHAYVGLIADREVSRNALTSQKSAFLTHLRSGTPDTLQSYVSSSRLVDAADRRLAADQALPGQGSAAYQAMVAERTRWLQWQAAVMAAPPAAGDLVAINATVVDANARFARYTDAENAYSARLRADQQAAYATSQEIAGTGRLLTIGGGLLVVLTLMGLAGLFLSQVARPLRRLAEVAERMRDSGTQQAVPFLTKRDEIGQLARALAEWREAQLARRAQQAQFASIVTTAPIGIIRLDVAGRVLAANPCAEELLGRRGDELIGGDVASLLAGADSGALAQDLAAMAHGAPVESEREVTLERPDGTSRACSVRFTAVRSSGDEVEFCYALLEDLSARRQAMRAERENLARARFMGQMSHELRTPLNAVLGFSQLLSDATYGELNARQARAVGHIESSARHLVTLIDDLLDISKVSAGKMEVVLGPVLLDTVVDEFMGRMEPIASAKAIRLGATLAGAPVWVTADPHLVRQAVANLLSNALKYTKEGGSVQLALGRSDTAGWLRVTDTGVGIPADQQDAIFDDFKRVAGVYQDTQQGTGLGLSLVKQYMALMSGAVRVESAPGQGSVFTLSLPPAAPPER